MSKRDMKRRKCPPFVRLDRAMVDSVAFNTLRPASVMVLISILRRHNGMNGSYTDPIICPYSKMKGGLAPATIAKALRQLEEFGFVEFVQRGGLYKQPNSFALSYEWRNWHQNVNKSQHQKLKHVGSEIDAMGVSP